MPLTAYDDNYSSRPFSAGQIINAFTPDRIVSRLAGGGTAQTQTVQVTSVTNSVLHELVITYNGNPVTVGFTADGTATVNEVAAGLEAAIDAEPELGGLFVASVSTDTITLTGRIPGLSWTTAEGSNGNLAATITNTVASAEATAIPFGRGVVQRASLPNQCLLPSTANATALAIDATPVAENAIIYSLTVLFDLDGKGVRPYTFGYTSDGSATVAEITAAITAGLNARLPANSVLVTDNTTKITLSSEVPNLRFTVEGLDAGATSAWTIAEATPIVPLRFLGISVQSQSVQQSSSGAAEYAGGSPVSILTEGLISVELDANSTPAVGSPVWCRASATSPEVLGAFRASQDAGDCFRVANACWMDSDVFTVGGRRLARLLLLPATL